MATVASSPITNYLSTQQAARLLDYTLQHTRLLIRQGKIKAERLGRDWLVLRESVVQYRATLSFLPRLPESRNLETIVNVASIPMRSPFRYPGGKTWLVPRVRQWLRSRKTPFEELVEPFAGGGIVSLTAVFENLVKRVMLVEIDADIAAVWRTILDGDAEWLGRRIVSFKMSHENIKSAIVQAERSIKHRAFATILRNRINRGGILAPGAGIVKNGENGKGLGSRWYPTTLRRRILDIAAVGDQVLFLQQDGLDLLRARVRDKDVAFFIDPPYTVAGRRLYVHALIDHEELFALANQIAGDFLMTYDDCPEIQALANRYGFAMKQIPMKNTHHAKKMELLIGRELDWCSIRA